MRNAMNEVLRDAYIRDCEIGLKRWNMQIKRAGYNFELKLPSNRFRRAIGAWANIPTDLDGRPIDREELDRRMPGWLPSASDKSLRHESDATRGRARKMAAWIAPPERGINNLHWTTSTCASTDHVSFRLIRINPFESRSKLVLGLYPESMPRGSRGNAEEPCSVVADSLRSPSQTCRIRRGESVGLRCQQTPNGSISRPLRIPAGRTPDAAASDTWPATGSEFCVRLASRLEVALDQELRFELESREFRLEQRTEAQFRILRFDPAGARVLRGTRGPLYSQLQCLKICFPTQRRRSEGLALVVLRKSRLNHRW